MEYYTCDNSNTIAYNGDISAKDLWKDVLTGINIETGKLGGNISAVNPYKSNLDVNSAYFNSDYGITLNEDAIKDIVEKLTKQKETAKITPDEGPEIPKWTGFLPI